MCSLVLVLIAVGLPSCRHQDTPHRSDALIVCPGAEAISWRWTDGRDQLAYEVEVPYPADGVISCISGKLSQNGWQPLKEDFWNPRLPSSQVRGWTQFEDATAHPEQHVWSWMTQWQNQADDLAWYALEYRYPPKGRYTLHIYAGFIPANIAKNMPKTSRKEVRPAFEQTLFSEAYPIEHPVPLSSNILRTLLATKVAKSGLNYASDSDTVDSAKLFEASEIHLGRPDEVDLIVMGVPPMRGADNTWFWVIRSAHNNPKIVLWAGCDLIEVTNDRANSLKNIRTVWSDASDTYTAVYQFDGTQYKLKSSKSEQRSP